MGYPVVESLTFGHDSNKTSHSIPMPSTVNMGDLLLLLYAQYRDDDITIPTGWTTRVYATPGGRAAFLILSKVAVGNEGGTTITITSSTSQYSTAYKLYRISNYGGLEISSVATDDSRYPDTPSLTPSWGSAEYLWLSVFGAETGRDVNKYPTNFTDAAGEVNTPQVTSSRRLYEGASLDPGSYELNTATNWAGVTIAITSIIPPTATTSAVSNITHNTAQANGNITDNGGQNCDERGFVYGTTTQSDPGNTAPASSGYDSYENETGSYSTGTYNLTLSSLTENQLYYVRAYAHNSAGYSYGGEVSFRTNLAESLGVATINALALSLTDDVAYFETLGVAAAVARATKIAELILNPVIMTTCYPQSIYGSNLTMRGVANGEGITTRGFLIWTEDWDYPPET